ncbi:MAG: hypothetical protein ACI92E_000198 [Oceanicoccus sp.]|jgi:hypothetical protein
MSIDIIRPGWPMPMKLIYTNENRILVSNARNILANAQLDCVIKNEFSSSGVGELPAFDTWLELWIVNDNDFETATKLLDSSFAQDSSPEWTCASCHEKNSASFEICWNCQAESPENSKIEA